ncbi:hypothetical protein C8J57DRAFT_1588254 [Mycena rebaudengoi]|nr:hypothetical protein C8J57DRAFT_1588254 [Mycena rebaudengoi]
MPPKAKLREDDFHYSEDRSHVQCKACGSSKWIAVKSAAKHLTSVEHLKTLELGEDARKRREELEKERQTDSATTELRSIQFAASRLPSGPIGSTSSGLHARSEAEVEMWEAYESTSAAFSAGEDPDDTHIHHKRLREEVESFGVQNPEAAARNLGFGDGDVAAEMLAEDEEEDFLSEIMRNAGECRIELWHELVVWFRPNWDHHMTVRVLPPFQTGASRLDFFASDRVTSLDSQSTGIEDPNPEEIQADGSARSGSDPEWFPYPSRLVGLPRLRISGSLMRVFLWVLKEAGCKYVPSFDHLRRVQKSLRVGSGVPTIPCKSVQGNVFFMNDPAAIIAQDWANPTIRKLIHVFPEIPKDGIIREIWHAQKWRKNMDLDMLSPMYDSRGSHYYVNEVSRLKNGNFVIPIRWVICNDKAHADVFSISFNDQGEATVLDEGTSLVCSEEFVENYLDLLHVRKIPKWAAGSIEAGHSARMPNLKRALAGGDPLYCSFVDYFGDDVSGNRTKSWNKHWNAYMTHRNLPRECLQQEFHTHFISTSPNASVTEQFNEFKSRVEYGYLVYFVPTNLTAAHNRATHVEPVKVRDESGGTTRFCIHVNHDLKVTVANVLDVFSMIDPSKIITKIKYHLLLHIDEDAVEFGPLLGVITEIYECFNAIFRFCSILSNHLAPSRDIAIQLGDQEGLKHRLTGGWWYHNNEWQKAGPGVCQFMAKHPVLQKLLGWGEPKTLVHGNTKPVPTPRGQIQMVIHELQSTSAAHAVNFGMYAAELMWTKCREVISESLDPCFIGSWVFAESATEKGITVSGRISEILQGDNSIVVLVVELFQVLSSRDEIYGMPVLVRRDSEITYSIIPAKNLKFKFNVQHDCYSAKCEATGVRMQMQERVESDKIENYIVHNSLDRYIINSHAFHNAHLLRATLPRDLLAPILLFPDRRVKHDELASDLRETLDTKRTKQAAAAEQKRKASPMDNGDDSARPRKRARTRVASSTVPAGETMVGSRGKRKITRTAKAMEMAEETVPIDDSSDDADLYDDPDSGDSD